jgi:DNA-binding transcriptional MerR regulator
MSELAEASGVSAGTIKHYLREGLLPEPVRTSRNMAYYPPDFVERVRLIKQLQEQRFMPLKVIRRMLTDDPERTRALIELEDRVLETAMAGEDKRISAAELHRRYDIPREVIARLAELGVLTPNSRGYSPSDVKIVEAICRFRAGGYDERIGFTVYDTLRYKSELVESGAEPLQDLISALHSKLLVAELRRQREKR